MSVPQDVKLTFDPETPSVALSPDGRQIVFVGDSEGERLYLLDLQQPDDASPIAGTDGARSPFFSPDGQWVGYFSRIDSQLKKIAVSGGAPVTLSDAELPFGAPI